MSTNPRMGYNSPPATCLCRRLGLPFVPDIPWWEEAALKTRPEFPSRMTFFVVLLLLPFAVSAQTSPKDSQGSSILGFSPASAAAEHKVEATFETLPSPEKAREWHRLFTAE